MIEPEGKKDGQDEVFDTAFDQAEESIKPDLSAADDPANIKVEKVEPVVPVVETPPVVVVPAAPVVDEEQKFEQRYKTLVGVHKHDREVWETEKATLVDQIEQFKKVPEPDKALTAKEGKKRDDAIQNLLENLTDEQKIALKEYDEEFDIVSKMEGIKRDAALAKLRKEVDDFKTDILAQLAPAQNLVVETQKEKEIRSKEEHFGAIAKAHPDYETYRDDGSILKWIETKPSYAQKGILEAYKSGTAEDIVSLLTDFKEENNIQVKKPDNTVDFNAAKREQKRQALADVTTKRGAVNASMPVAEDFENAFEEALHKGL